MFKNFFIRRLVSLLGSKKLFSEIKDVVTEMESTTLSGAEKRDSVLKELKDVFGVVAGFLVNVLLELAILYIRK